MDEGRGLDRAPMRGLDARFRHRLVSQPAWQAKLMVRSLRAAMTDLPTPWRSEQLCDGHAERLSESIERADGQVQVTCFDLLKVPLHETELLRELGLGQPALEPQFRNSSPHVSQEPRDPRGFLPSHGVERSPGRRP